MPHNQRYPRIRGLVQDLIRGFSYLLIQVQKRVLAYKCGREEIPAPPDKLKTGAQSHGFSVCNRVHILRRLGIVSGTWLGSLKPQPSTPSGNRTPILRRNCRSEISVSIASPVIFPAGRVGHSRQQSDKVLTTKICRLHPEQNQRITSSCSAVKPTS